jgi:hypothetical protein
MLEVGPRPEKSPKSTDKIREISALKAQKRKNKWPNCTLSQNRIEKARLERNTLRLSKTARAAHLCAILGPPTKMRLIDLARDMFERPSIRPSIVFLKHRYPLRVGAGPFDRTRIARTALRSCHPANINARAQICRNTIDCCSRQFARRSRDHSQH